MVSTITTSPTTSFTSNENERNGREEMHEGHISTDYSIAGIHFAPCFLPTQKSLFILEGTFSLIFLRNDGRLGLDID